MLYTTADFELDERHVIKNEKVALDRLQVQQYIFLVLYSFIKNVPIPIMLAARYLEEYWHK